MPEQDYLFDEFHELMQSAYAACYQQADSYEQVGITLCLAPFVQPQQIDSIIRKELGPDGDFPIVGGIRGTQHRGIIPTGEMWMYFCCHQHLAQRIHFINILPEYLSTPEALLNIEPA